MPATFLAMVLEDAPATAPRRLRRGRREPLVETITAGVNGLFSWPLTGGSERGYEDLFRVAGRP
jgi:hypothetical protein